MFKKLFSPQKINNCEIPNRLAVTAMVANYCNEDGTASDRYIAYHEAKAKGGWGLIITEDYAVNENAMGYKYIAGLWNDEQIESHKKLTDTIHKYESKIFAQIYHAGRQSSSHVNRGMQPVAPSAIPCPWLRELPKELTIAEIEQIVEDFGDCALRAQKAGFDGVEVHAGHGYLLAEFMSTYVNKRTDKYGGCLDNRVRIIKEVYENIRSKVGNDFPVTIRFSAIEGFEGGRDISESRVLAKLFEEWGFDALHVSNGAYGDHNRGGIVAPMYYPHAFNVDSAAEIKKLVNIPVFTVNRINDPRMCETILELDKADFIGMGRGSLADPELPNKAKAGDLTSIRYCIGCLQGCVEGLYQGGPISCLVNPTLGREGEIDYSKVDEPKSVLVIGGGPGGLEAARTAAIKGHKVSIYEKREFLGGQFKSASYPPCKGELGTYIAWAANELDKLGVEIHLNTEVTKELVDKIKPDLIIAATGGTPLMPPIKGIDKPHVVAAEDALLGKVPTGDRIVVAGGGEVGGETAAHLAMQQKDVSVVEMCPTLFRELDGVNKYNIMKILDEYEVKRHTETKVVEILDDGVVVENNKGQFTIPADTVVIGLGYKPNNKFAEELKESYDNVIIIGGAVKTSNALVATREGFDAGISIK
ncbi:FAD-dependent oxidoreductase [Clostridium beijerinckii]|uniref:NADH:flavin oxidoreductase n=1 Tax=Clostridium beijerinckii TaxID=1520 RepID=A0A1S9N446_CLOBE|nr:FAD-dependent oxidoreductase [Clostridium beijerinckii]MZK51439.1 FAD-dependent oxidoreductase [Clostridium beijerinckii]MZK59639.1 FAD-dependent oxidoreductase [Clostridium beijerinckii]MZK69759.1 FAD-dependent oxidoreductase [Clostridium beijerinckii]MZK75137.1 FAD-dependent oxidoreductase [Clostridium beijerinckii]MZK84849.1 FAD-dependent oxidoreductase [Clostridium beijerinckii]